MSAVEMQFRTAAFGGFQKQDVLEYIDRTNREHTQQMEALRQELEEASKARLAMEEERAECGRTAEILRDQVAQLEREGETLRQTEEQARHDAEEAQRELADLRERLADAEEQLNQAQGRIAQLEPSAQAYERLKDRTAGIELEAHQRAQGIQGMRRMSGRTVSGRRPGSGCRRFRRAMSRHGRSCSGR